MTDPHPSKGSILMADWHTKQLWCQQIERRLLELGALVKGNLPAQADRIADVLEQVDEVRKEVAELRERMDKASDWVKNHVQKHNGGTQS